VFCIYFEIKTTRFYFISFVDIDDMNLHFFCDIDW